MPERRGRPSLLHRKARSAGSPTLSPPPTRASSPRPASPPPKLYPLSPRSSRQGHTSTKPRGEAASGRAGNTLASSGEDSITLPTGSRLPVIGDTFRTSSSFFTACREGLMAVAGLAMWKQETTDTKLVSACSRKKTGCPFKIIAKGREGRWVITGGGATHSHGLTKVERPVAPLPSRPSQTSTPLFFLFRHPSANVMTR